MANTLNLGNGNWAVKKDSLLAYNSENGNYKPLPFDFTRASSATVVNQSGLIETVGSGIPRIDFQGNTKGALLLEPSRTNSILKSDDVLSTYQSQSGNVSNASESINGFNNSIQIEYDASNSLVYKRDFTPTIGTEYTISCFVQMNDNSAPIHTVDANSGDFCLINNNTVVSASDIKTERLTSTNVYRVSATKTASDTNNRFGIIKYSTQSSKGFKVTGFQLEEGSYPTSYIPTSGSAVTRVADACNNGGNEQVFNDSEGTVFVNFAADFNIFGSGGADRGISINNGSNTNSARIFQANTLNNRMAYDLDTSSGTNQVFNTSTTFTDITDFNKVAFTYKQNEFKIFLNGVQQGATDTSGSVFSNGTLNGISFDYGQEGNKPFFGRVKEVNYFDTALTDQELIALTS